jgi:hypothetical protein
MKGIILLVVALFSFTTFATNRYKINAKIIVDGKEVSNPQLVVNEGEPAEVEIDNSPGKKENVKFRVLATDVADEKVKNEILMKFNVEYKSATRDVRAAPQVLAKEGSEATVRIGNRTGMHDIKMKVVASRE